MRDDATPLAVDQEYTIQRTEVDVSKSNYSNQQTKTMGYLDRPLSSIVRGKYGIKFVKEIGSGYAGTVYKCLRATSRRDVTSRDAWLAVKVMYKGKIKPKAAETEARLLRRARGPNILSYLGASECQDAYLLVTEFCGCGDLHGMLGLMDAGHVMARSYLHGVAVGLRHLHSLLIAHCDVKMRNIVIDDRNVPKIADFGFAVQVQQRTSRLTSCVGTKDYWAPEMWAARPCYVPWPTDVYALGVTFLGVCEKRPIKRKDNDIHDIVENLQDIQMRDLFRGFLEPQPADRVTLADLMSHPWMTGYLTPPSSPLPSPSASPSP